MSTTVQYRYLAPDPKSSYRQLFIKGTRIRARTLYGMLVSAAEPRSIADIALDYQLPVPAVEEAIAYCRSNPREIQDDLKQEEALMRASGVASPEYKFNPKPRFLLPRRLRKSNVVTAHEALPGR
jgi:uncharacterized protein (DUF433 family)